MFLQKNFLSEKCFSILMNIYILTYICAYEPYLMCLKDMVKNPPGGHSVWWYKKDNLD